MNNIVYTKPGCFASGEAKKLLDRLGIPYEERLIEEYEEREKIKAKYNWRTFPIVILNGKMLGGYDAIKALADQGKLVDILSE
jgi:glutaredoxin 3